MTPQISSDAIAEKLRHNQEHLASTMKSAKAGYDKAFSKGQYTDAVSYMSHALDTIRYYHAVKSVWGYYAARKEMRFLSEAEVVRMITGNAEQHSSFLNFIIGVLLRNHIQRSNSITTSRLYTQGGALQFLSHFKRADMLDDTKHELKLIRRYIAAVNKKLIFGKLETTSRYFLETNGNVFAIAYTAFTPEEMERSNFRPLVKSKLEEFVSKVAGAADISIDSIKHNVGNNSYYANDLMMNEALFVFTAMVNLARYSYEQCE